MTTTPDYEILSQRVEQVIHEHLAASRKAVEAAVLRAFAAGPRVPLRAAVPDAPRSRKMAPRRPPEELVALQERLLEEVRGRPGETMTVLAAHLGLPSRALHLPMAHLKRRGQVRSVGERHFTRYFPMAAESPDSRVGSS